MDITEKEPHNGDAVNTPLLFFFYFYIIFDLVK